MREANINIKYSDFLSCSLDMLTETQVKIIFKRAAKYNPVRLNLTLTPTNRKKVVAVLRPHDLHLFNSLLTMHRQALKHRFSLITEFDSEWKTLGHIAADADEFSRLFDFTIQQGYGIYIELGIKYMGKSYALSKFKYYKTRIFSHQESLEIISKDPDPELTIKVYNYYLRNLGIKHNDAFHKAQIVNFIHICDILREHKIRYDKYMDLNLSFYKKLNTIPEPKVLHSIGAIERSLILKSR